MWFIGVEVEIETSAPPPKKKFWIRPCNCVLLLWFYPEKHCTYFDSRAKKQCLIDFMMFFVTANIQ